MSKSAAQLGFEQVPCLVKDLDRPEPAINDSGKSPLAIGRTSTADLQMEIRTSDSEMKKKKSK
jgi:hypothetical protein